MEVWTKSETVDPEVRAYVYSLVNAVGGQSTLDDRYAIGDDALAVLNDLLRWLRLYDEKTNRYDVKRCLAEANLVKGDLLEILALWPEDGQENNRLKSKLALACLQLLVPLTWPTEFEEEKTTVNHMRHGPYLQLAQVGYKRAILHYEDASILRTAVRIGLPCMAQPRRERSRRDEGIIKLLLYFVRNMSMITQPQHLPSQGDENEVSRSATISAFHAQDIFSLLLTIASGAGDEYQTQDVIVLETLFHLLKGVDAKKLFMKDAQLASEETDELQSLMRREKAMLNSYNKHAPSRHNRFGTMLWVKRDNKKMSTVTGQNSITNNTDSTTLYRMDASKKWNRPKHRGKITADEFKEISDFGERVDLTEQAHKDLRVFVEDFLDSGFNPLFSSLRKAMEREAERVGDVHRKQYFYLISWFLSASAARRDRSYRESAHTPAPEDNTFAYVAAVLDQETFLLLNRHMQAALDHKDHSHLHATLLAFTQILLTIQDMAGSEDEEDQEIAENIQQRIFYEEGTHDRIVQVLRGYKSGQHGQGSAYLDTVTECVHVFVRMLEKYSKQNADLQIRSKRRARRKKKEIIRAKQDDPSAGTPQSGDEDEAEKAAEDERDAHRAVSERKFDFARFSAKFLTQPCIETFLALLHFHADLTTAQLKRCHRFLYRLAFKADLVVLLFRVDILALLHKMIKGPAGLNPGCEGFKEWETLVQQVFRRCVKWMERETEGEGWREAAIVEMLFSKVPGTVFYLQNGYERVIERRPPRPPAELEIKTNVVEEGKRVGVAVSVMLERGEGAAVEWVKRELQNAAEERQALADERASKSAFEREAEDGEVPELGAMVSAPAIFIGPDTDDRKTQLFKDKFLRLLLTTLGLQRLGNADDVDASWIIPPELSTARLKEALEQIRKAEFDGVSLEEGVTAMDCIRNKSSARRGGAAFSDEESGDENEDGDEQIFPANLPEKRKKNGDGRDEDPVPKKKRRLTRRNHAELTEEQAKAKTEEMKQKERERNNKIKSQLMVTESDDESDEEADREFFRAEEERRRKMKGFIRSTLRKEKERAKRGKAGKGRGAGPAEKETRREGGDDDDEDRVDSDMDIDFDRDAESPHRLQMDHNLETEAFSETVSSDLDGDDHDPDLDSDADEPTSSTPPTAIAEPAENTPLAALSGNVASKAGVAAKRLEAGQNDDDEEDDVPIAKPAVRRHVRAGFVIDDDSDEE